MTTTQPPQDAPSRGKGWQVATVTAVIAETHDVKTFSLAPEVWRPFRAGQHVDVRLTAPDGYQAQRSYSIASEPERAESIDITIELLDDGEVSPYFHEVVQAGDQVEIRGPIGGPFTWRTGDSDALLLVGGGSGVVPLMSMLRHRAAAATDVRPAAPALLLYSSRTESQIIYRRELDAMDASDELLAVRHTLTREQPEGWAGDTRRVDREMFSAALAELTSLAPNASAASTMCYICGPTDFVEAVAQLAVAAGIPDNGVRTERFGPTGT